MTAGRALSLRARLWVGMALVASVLVAVSVLVTTATRDQLLAQVDQRLASSSPRPGADPDRFRPRGPTGGSGPPSGDEPERVSDVYEGYVDDDGTLVTRFGPNVGGDHSPPVIAAADLPASGRRTFTTDSVDGERTYRVRAERIGDVVAITALPLDDVEATIARLVLVEVLGSSAILAALGLVGWWVVHLGIRPVKEMTETATRIAAGDVDVRIPESAAGTESGRLAVALNRMLGTIGDALDEATASEERLRRFVADASHELRTPVTTVRGYAELYRLGGLSEPGALDDAMRRTEQEAVRMGRLVDDMLLLAQLDEERPHQAADVDVAQLVRDAAADARAASPERPIEVEVDPAGMTVPGDEDRLRQVLANVVANALVHTAPDVAIELRARRTGDDVTVEVTDHGEGMAPEVAARVTQRFFRADPARSRHRGGSGLGLSIVDAVVRAHGGTVAIDSHPGRGTTVRLVLPAPPP